MTDFSLMKIIVVEDDPLSSKLITGLLETNGLFNISNADSGEACLDLLKTIMPDIALIDIGLPGISGLEICKILRAKKETQYIPIIIITGGPMPSEEAVSKSFEAGATDFITKPIDSVSFMARVKSALNIKRYQDRLNNELSRRKQAEDSLSKSESLLRNSFEATQDLLSVHDRDLRVVYSNWYGHEYIPEEKRTGNPFCYSVYMNRDKPCKPCHALKVFETGKANQLEHTNPVDGITREVNVYPVFDESGKVIMVTEHIRDITQRKQMEKTIKDKESQLRQAQKMKAVGTLAGGIAHDFNNLLYIISGNTEILMDNENIENTLLLKEILKSTQRGSDLVKQLLTFSHKAEVNLLPTSLNAGIKRLKTMIERIFPKMIDIRLTLDENLNLINADKSQIEQVLINLCLNARDAMNDEGLLTIKTENITYNDTLISNYSKEDGPWIKLSVSDTGTGMDKETQERIFDPFFTTKEIGKGTGLGLSVIYGIIKAHKGFIFCESTPNTGTTFNLYFLAAKKSADADISDSPKRLPRGLLQGNETILIADDEKSVLDITQAIIELLGYQTMTANNGESALNIFSKKPNEIDLVLLDLGMPGMGGKKCLEKLISFKPNVKVIIASGYSEHGLIKDAMEYGAKASVIKPYTMNEISKVLRDVLDEKHAD